MTQDEIAVWREALAGALAGMTATETETSYFEHVSIPVHRAAAMADYAVRELRRRYSTKTKEGKEAAARMKA